MYAFVCVYLYVYICTYVFVCVYLYVCICMCIFVCIYLYVCMYLYVYICMHVFVCIDLYVSRSASSIGPSNCGSSYVTKQVYQLTGIQAKFL